MSTKTQLAELSNEKVSLGSEGEGSLIFYLDVTGVLLLTRNKIAEKTTMAAANSPRRIPCRIHLLMWRSSTATYGRNFPRQHPNQWLYGSLFLRQLDTPPISDVPAR